MPGPGEQAAEVLEFWFVQSRPRQWFAKDSAFDALLRERFLGLTRRAIAGEFDAWGMEAAGGLALLQLVRQRWAIENQWQWPRDTQLGEDAHHYAQRNGVQVLALLRTLALNLLRCNGFRSIRAGLMAVAHDICRMLSWIGISTAETG